MLPSEPGQIATVLVALAVTAAVQASQCRKGKQCATACDRIDSSGKETQPSSYHDTGEFGRISC